MMWLKLLAFIHHNPFNPYSLLYFNFTTHIVTVLWLKTSTCRFDTRTASGERRRGEDERVWFIEVVVVSGETEVGGLGRRERTWLGIGIIRINGYICGFIWVYWAKSKMDQLGLYTPIKKIVAKCKKRGNYDIILRFIVSGRSRQKYTVACRKLYKD